MNVLSEILAWSGSRPAWQRDALRRILLQDALTAGDFTDLVSMVRVQYGLSVGAKTPPTPVPLASEHLSAAGYSSSAVMIRAVGEFENVNAIESGHLLTFEPSGVTVVYGENGAGKSGYARVLKKMCRARAVEGKIRSDASRATGVVVAKGTIVYEVDGVRTELRWTEGGPGPDALAEVSVFDSRCAAIYVERETDVAYRPLGLDLLAKLARLCDAVRRELSVDLMALSGPRITTGLFQPGTKAQAFISGLTASTTEAMIDSQAAVSDAQRQRLRTIREQLAQLTAADPGLQAAQLRARASRLEGEARTLRALSSSLAPSVADALRQAIQNERRLAAAAALASKMSFGEEPVPGVGTEAWRALWDSARAFAAVALPGVAFPPTKAGSLCVLCHQELTASALSRFERFDRFVRDDSQRRADEAGVGLQSWSEQLRALAVAGPDEPTVAEFDALDRGLGAEVRQFRAAALVRRDSLIRAVRERAWSDVPSLGEAPIARLESQVAAAKTSAEALEAASQPEGRTKLESELRELEDREKLLSLREQAVAEIGRLGTAAKLRAAIDGTDTNAITRKSTELTGQAVTKTLCDQFALELKVLGLSHLSVALASTGGEKAILFHRIAMTTPDGYIVPAPDEIFSEGEYGCIALAAFLAELGTQESPSAVIFDDPVSSLDHRRREAIARRLVGVAEKRQVVIFTHDLVFLLLLQEFALASHVAFAGRHVQRLGHATGIPVEEMPWYGMTVKQRLGYLRKEWQRIEKLFRTGPRDAYDRDAAWLYGRLRETWERGVEEVLLAGAVMRFQRDVHTRPLAKVDVMSADYDAIESGMTKCSTYLSGHDAAPEVNLVMPEPPEVRSDIEAVQSWVDSVALRRKQAPRRPGRPASLCRRCI